MVRLTEVLAAEAWARTPVEDLRAVRNMIAVEKRRVEGGLCEREKEGRRNREILKQVKGVYVIAIDLQRVRK